MKYKIISKDGYCEYEEYDNIKNRKCNCGNLTNIKVGNKSVCNYHLSAVMLADKNPEMEDCRDVYVDGEKIKQNKIIEFVPDFLKLAKGEEVTDTQLEMEF